MEGNEAGEIGWRSGVMEEEGLGVSSVVQKKNLRELLQQTGLQLITLERGGKRWKCWDRKAVAKAMAYAVWQHRNSLSPGGGTEAGGRGWWKGGGGRIRRVVKGARAKWLRGVLSSNRNGKFSEGIVVFASRPYTGERSRKLEKKKKASVRVLPRKKKNGEGKPRMETNDALRGMRQASTKVATTEIQLLVMGLEKKEWRRQRGRNGGLAMSRKGGERRTRKRG